MSKLDRIRQQVLTGSEVRFTLRDGTTAEGRLTEVDGEMVVLEPADGCVETIVIDAIVHWKVLRLPEAVRQLSPAVNATAAPEARALSHVQIPIRPTVVEMPASQPHLTHPREPAEEHAEHPDEFPPSQPVNPPPFSAAHASPAPAVSQSALTAVLAIDARFSSQGAQAVLQFEPPEPVFSSDGIPESRLIRARQSWHSIMNRYDNARRIGELTDLKFGRLQVLLSDFRSFVAEYPNNGPGVRLLAYLMYLAAMSDGKTGESRYREAVETYAKLFQSIRNQVAPIDWLSLAALATRAQQPEIACFALDNYFAAAPISENAAWFLYSALLRTFHHYQPLADLLQSQRQLTDTETATLRSSLLYLITLEHSVEQAARASETYPAVSRNACLELLKFLPGSTDPPYRATARALLDTRVLPQTEVAEPITTGGDSIHGRVTEWKVTFGFVVGPDSKKYFFHKSAVMDPGLLDKLSRFRYNDTVSVFFEAGEGPNGPIADKVVLARPPQEILSLAQEQADEGEYAKAASTAKQALALDPHFEQARISHDRWTKWAAVPAFTRGRGPWARADRAKIVERDLEKAEKWYLRAISEKDRFETSVKDLGMLLIQRVRHADAIEFLTKYRNRVADPQKVDGILHIAYAGCGRYVEAAEMLQRRLSNAGTATSAKRASTAWMVANLYIKAQEYGRAEKTLQEIVSADPLNAGAARLLAVCHMRQNRAELAERILRELIARTSDPSSAELLAAIQKARETGQRAEVDQIIVETEMQDVSPGITAFASFFLSRCKVTGTRNTDDQGRYVGDDDDARRDIAGLREAAAQVRARDIDPSSSYLSAAKIGFDLGLDSWSRDLANFFQSRANSTAATNRDAAWEWYLQALILSGDDLERPDSDLVKILFLRLRGTRQPPRSVRNLYDAITFLMENHGSELIDTIAQLTIYTKKCADVLLQPLYKQSTWQVRVLQYIAGRGLATPAGKLDFKEFVRLWESLRSEMTARLWSVSKELHVLRRCEITVASLQNALERVTSVKAITDPWFLALDQQRISAFRRIIELAINLCNEPSFEERDRLSSFAVAECKSLLESTAAYPTRLSIEDLYPVVERLQDRLSSYVRAMYDTSRPHLSVQPMFEAYTPNEQRVIKLQFEIYNKPGCSPAENFDLALAEDQTLFTGDSEARLLGSIRGGERRELELTIKLTGKAVQTEAFDVLCRGGYRLRTSPDSEESTELPEFNVSVNLTSEEEWEDIPNPYEAYAKGGPVKNGEMFFGRGPLIETLAASIESRASSKGIVIWGQKRSGKSSVQHHLIKRLSCDPDIIIVDLKSLTGLIDGSSQVPLLSVLLWSILDKTQIAIASLQKSGRPAISFQVPSDIEFYNHPHALALFNRLFEQLRTELNSSPEWADTRVVVTIDEFSQAYKLMSDGKLPDTFMKNWKALLEANYFKAVLVGQDIMERIKDIHANESASMQFERVDYLSQEDAFELMDRPIRIGGVDGKTRYKGDAKERLFKLTAGNPFYLQFLCYHIVLKQNADKLPYINVTQIDKVLRFLLDTPQTPLSRGDFDNLFDPKDPEFVPGAEALAVLALVAKNSRTGSACPESVIVANTGVPVQRILAELVQRKVLQREREDAYSIRVGLFKEWLLRNL